MAWPPILDDLKVDMRIADDRDDAALQVVLAAAVAFVERVHAGRFDFTNPAGGTLPVPNDDTALGTLRLAARWHSRRKSANGLVEMAELGASRIPAFDADIERLLKIGRYRRSVIA